MRLAAVGELQEGDVLGRTQFDNSGRILVPAGFRLKSAHLEKLSKNSTNRIPVMDLGEHELAPGQILRQIVAKRIDLELNNGKLPKPEEVIPNWSEESLMDALVEHPAWTNPEVLASTITRLRDVLKEAAANQITTVLSLPTLPENAWIEFGVRCAALSVIMAHEYNYPLRDMTAVASAALIHFIGRTVFESINPEGSSETDFEKVIAREHPTFASLIVRGSDPESELEHYILLQQEEKYNGHGFPQGLRGADQPPKPQRRYSASTMLPHSELLNVCIGFETLRDNPQTRLKNDLLSSVEQLASSHEQRYNNFALETLCQLLQRFPVGSRVKIRGNSSGRYLGFSGIVRKAEEATGSLPVKEIYITHDPQGQQIEPVHIDFSDESQISLVWH